MVKVAWHGHACFEIVSSKGLTLGIDPHDGKSLGIKPPRFKADVVLLTHEHFDHNVAQAISKPDSKVYRMFTGDTSQDDVRIKGFMSYHDKFKGSQRGRNVIYKITVDEINIVHVGDLGDFPSEDIIKELKGAHVLMTPVGGTFTLEPEEVVELISYLEPKIVIPMHYKIPGLRLPIKDVEYFLRLCKWNIERLDRNYLEVTVDTIPLETIVKVLTPP